MESNRILVKLRPSNALRAAESRVNLRPLYDEPPAAPAGFGFDATPRWFLADLPEGAATPWDLAHSQVAGQLGVAESDVVFAEPDRVHNVFPAAEEVVAPFAAGGPACTADEQDPGYRKAVGSGFAWHLGDDFSQLGAARAAVVFSEPRTRIAHLDTGYFPGHETVPAHLLTDLGRNFVERDGAPGDAADPDNRRLILDNSGHGTGTLSILAGGRVSAAGAVLGGAPEAEVVPLRVADSVVLLRTSALAQAIRHAVRLGCQVATLSMGGWPSRAWAEAVDEAYEAGLCLCAAAGNHVGIAPPRRLVYPARFPRVIAVCGAMADGRPYADLAGRTLEGSFGPDSAMGAAIAAYTPNIPWARYGCANVVRLNGEGTSSATPQVAAAAALWLERHKAGLPAGYQRVEAVRHALFSSAAKVDREHFGNGLLRARAALDVAPMLGLPRSKASDTSFAFLRLVTGLGLAGETPHETMFNLEVAQRWLVNERLQEIVPDPEAIDRLDAARERAFMEALLDDPEISRSLRRQVENRLPLAGRVVVPPPLAREAQPALTDPPHRRLRVYALDPSASTQLATAGVNEVTVKVRWEKLESPGPVGEYLAVEGVGGDAVDLDRPQLLAQDGWAPSEGNPQFHQQMVYAVAMKTIEHFERALGRPVLWRPRPNPDDRFDDSGYVRRLTVRPRALEQANAYYSPAEVALLFGTFRASANDPGNHMPGSRVYTCLSHDIVAHETTHAIVDGMHRRFNEATNPDVLAFHEAFADIVALFQHFTLPEILEKEIARSRGDLESETVLGSLAVQFGHAQGGRAALRDAIGRIENGRWQRFEPNPTDLQKRQSPHARGAILVAAVFDAFLAIYKERVADLVRIYTGGTGVLPAGAIHPDLVRRLAGEAATSAQHVLTMCIRALDYLPPVDVTFFEFLRALVTADFDVVADDRHNYRVALVEAFRRRGIYPLNLDDPSRDTMETLSVDTLRWQGLAIVRGTPVAAALGGVARRLKRYADECLYIDDRERLFRRTRRERGELKVRLEAAFAAVPDFARALGLDPDRKSFEVHALHAAIRPSPDGRYLPQLVVSLTQSEKIPAAPDGTPAHVFRGGSTLVVDLGTPTPSIKYCIFKRIAARGRRDRIARFLRDGAADPLRARFLGLEGGEPFAALHALGVEG